MEIKKSDVTEIVEIIEYPKKKRGRKPKSQNKKILILQSYYIIFLFILKEISDFFKINILYPILRYYQRDCKINSHFLRINKLLCDQEINVEVFNLSK
ncbi:hypothetical protein BpHYR1_009184 [Brachionus plicatilis]|uniref:Uncharacterized protein n=1 Tax=Brachionus plicatilis TaxID=10195 RepID=A0A3M7RNP0_BRAPC|nr:hypothetical protein BpHYR1_009184 [Brachionus plicatilis]